MKRTLTILLFMIMSLPCCPMTLQGGVTYTVETARKEAFDGVVYQIPVSTFSKYLTDPNYAANKKAMKSGQTDLGDRWVTRFSSGGYDVVYAKDRYKSFSYDNNGKLEYIGLRSALSFPSKTYNYKIDGSLDGVSLIISREEVYNFTPSGKMYSHWVGDSCFDESGNKVLERF